MFKIKSNDSVGQNGNVTMKNKVVEKNLKSYSVPLRLGSRARVRGRFSTRPTVHPLIIFNQSTKLNKTVDVISSLMSQNDFKKYLTFEDLSISNLAEALKQMILFYGHIITKNFIGVFEWT